MRRRALLVFADAIHLDLARRALPKRARHLFDVGALRRQISLTVDVHFFGPVYAAAGPASFVHPQTGTSFAARFDNAVGTIAQLGYDELVVIGRDCPTLSGADVERAFAELESSKLVLGPDHRGGCYLIGFRCADRGLLRNVRWKQNTDCAQLLQRVGDADAFLLGVKQDLDSWSDLRLFARCGDPLSRLAAFLLATVPRPNRYRDGFVSRASRLFRISQQLPPPAFAT